MNILYSINNKKHFYDNIQAPPVYTSHGMETKTDSNYEEVKYIVETPFTMEHNVAYSTTTTTHT